MSRAVQHLIQVAATLVGVLSAAMTPSLFMSDSAGASIIRLCVIGVVIGAALPALRRLTVAALGTTLVALMLALVLHPVLPLGSPSWWPQWMERVDPILASVLTGGTMSALVYRTVARSEKASGGAAAHSASVTRGAGRARIG